MKKHLLSLLLCLLSINYSQAQVTRSFDVTSGNLSTLVGNDKTTIIDLTLTGNINAADFETIRGMTALKNLDMTNVNVEGNTLPRQSFNGCKLNLLKLPASLQVVSSYGFEYAQIGEIDFSACVKLTTLGQFAFRNSTVGNSVLDLSNCSSLSFIDWHAFYEQKFHLIFPNHMEVLTTGTLGHFKGSATLSKNVKTIEYNALALCEMSELKLPSSLIQINKEAFNQSTIDNIDFTACVNLATLGQFAFRNSTVGNSVLDLSNCSSLSFIDWHAFYEQKFHLIFPNHMEVLTTGTLGHFNGSVKLPENLTTIQENAFALGVISKLEFPASLKILNDKALYGLKVDEIDFSKCTQLETLGNWSFRYLQVNSGTVDLSACSSLRNIGWGCFENQKFHITLPNGLTTLTKMSMSSFLGSVQLPETLETVHEAAFSQSVISKLEFPKSLKTFNDKALYGLKVDEIDFSKCTQLETLGNWAFEGLTVASGQIDLSNCSKLNSIGWGCFKNQGMTKVKLPANLANIAPWAFENCTNLTELTSLNPIPPALGGSVFAGVNQSSCKLFVPAGAVDAYKAADQWKEFVDVKTDNEDKEDPDKNTEEKDSTFNIQYSYDDAGNRKSRRIIEMKKSSIESPTQVPINPISERINDITAKIYPNPTKGQLVVELEEMHELKSGKLTLFNLKGQMIIQKNINSSRTDLDISSKPDGIYIMQISINGKTTSWRIIKE